ncbi:hypothetical protein Acid7E03_39300 [Acidisoma sp. 7E03]
MFPLRTALAAGAGVFAFAATSLAGQPVDLMAPTPLIPAGGAIQQAPLLSTEATGAPYTPSASGYLSAVPYLDAAQVALQSGRYSAARGALEQAETRLLNDGAVADTSSISAGGQALTQVRLARDAAIRHDRGTALTAVSMARAAAETPTPTQPMPIEAQAAAQAPAALPAPPPPPMITKALLPGHWQLGSWQYHRVPPETQLRTVETHPWVQGHYVWSGGAWTWNPSHYDDE